MNKPLLKYAGIVLYGALLIAPGWIFFAARGGFNVSLLELGTIFPLFGLYAFTLVAWQVILGSNMRRLRPIYPRIMNFHRFQGLFALLFAVIHPILIVMTYGLYATYISHEITTPALQGYVLVGELALTLILLTVITAVLAWKFQLLTGVWRSIHLLNYVAFIVAWTHSWFIGSDVQTTNLKYVWLFYLVAWLVSVALRIRPGNRSATSASSA